MMDIQTITSFIGSVGFPIVMTILLWQYIRDEQAKTREVLTELKETITVLTLSLKERGQTLDDDTRRL